MKSHAVIEITNKVVRCVIGDLDDGKPIIYFADEKPVEGLLTRGEIVDSKTLTEILNDVKTIANADLHLNLKLSDVTLVVPPLGLEVFQSEKSSGVVSSSGLVEQIDVRNVISLVSKDRITPGSEIVDIIPDYFVLEQGIICYEPPIGQKSNSIAISAKVYGLPSRVVSSYKNVILDANMSPKRCVVAPYAINEFIKTLPDAPKNYFLVDMGAGLTTVSLLNDGSLIQSCLVLQGGNDLTLQIADDFDIDPLKAEEIKQLYGINERELNFNPVILSGNRNYTCKDLNNSIKGYYENFFFKQLDSAFQLIYNSYPNQISRISALPIVFTGGCSNLKGIEKLFKEKYSRASNVRFVSPEFVGVRDPKYSASIGALIATLKYRGSLNDSRARVTSVGRVSEEK